ncbi:Rne/Rng family ribonuclease [Sutterella sp.]|uniref:Rne/Rng family ribonuclease n=1 Tax=Sutterella sp. TaxID=1981025 RepID=UPI0026DFBB61|nr:Rne/Rng family ribonuclease [Sutterella sp.]MDO5532156.1 Rne/Rng family ribonuclease [Sutterella sp.]
MKRMLFNATHPEETRVGIVDGQKLIDIDIETAGREARKSNIYMGVVTRIEPSLEACFVDYGEERHGFLPFKEISRSYFAEGVDVRMATIKEAIREGQELIVQVEKEERGNKGAALTTFISLAGRYLVLMPNNPRAGGVSRRIEGEERQELREAMDKLDLPNGMSTIARTAGIGRTTEELQWDLNYLLKLWEAIVDAARPQYEHVTEQDGRKVRRITNEQSQNGRNGKRVNPGPFLIVEESNLVVRAIRDYFQPEIGEILVDTDDIYEQARQFMAHVMPDMVDRVKRYRDDIPLFTRFQIEQQIETAYSRTVPLPSGGAIVIDHTEALVAIDVNSARATRGADIEDTAFRTNCEAADEVARQMRLRDLGGLIVIDFIDMAEQKNQRAVEQRLKDAIRYDRARVQTAKISRFGLMELSRQRLRPSLSEGSHVTCPRCNGVGVIRDTESCAIQVLRILQEEAMKEGTGAVQAQVPVDVATFLLNEKRNDITKLEARHKVPIILVPNTSLETPHYHIERIRQDDERLENMAPSFNLAEEIETTADDPYAQKSQEERPTRPKQVPVIKNLIEREPAPVHQEAEEEKAPETGRAKQLLPVTEKKSFFTRIINLLFGPSEEEKKAEEEKKKAAEPKKPEEKKEERRRTRGGRGDRRSSRGGRGRSDRSERSEAKDEQKSEKAEKQENRGRRGRGDRQVRADREERKPQAEAQQQQSRPETDAPDEERRSRRRPAEEEQQQAQTPETAVTAAAAEAQAPAAEAPAAAEQKAPEAAEAQTADVQTEAQAAPEGAAPAAAEEEAGEGARRRRPRRRRRTNRGAEGAETAEAAENAAAEGSEAAEAAPAEVKADEAPAAAEEKTEAKAEEKAAEEAAPAEAPAAEAQAEISPKPVAVTTEDQAEAKDEAEKPVVAKPEIDWQPASEELVQIETRHSAVSEAVIGAFNGAEQPAAHEGERRRSRRRKPRAEQQPEAPLEQVETKKKAEPADEIPDIFTLVEEKPAEAAPAPEVKAEPVAAPEPEVLEQVETKPAAAPVAEEAPVEAAPVEVAEAAEPAAETVTAEEAPEAVAEEAVPEEAAPAAELAIAEGLEENLEKAGLVQVHTAHPSAAVYEPIFGPGRKVERREADADEGPLVQVHTAHPSEAVYEPIFGPGRKVERRTADADEGPLEQVETKKA